MDIFLCFWPKLLGDFYFLYIIKHLFRPMKRKNKWLKRIMNTAALPAFSNTFFQI